MRELLKFISIYGNFFNNIVFFYTVVVDLFNVDLIPLSPTVLVSLSAAMQPLVNI